MYTIEFIDGPWEGQTYNTDNRHDTIELTSTKTHHSYYGRMKEDDLTIYYQLFVEEV